MLCIGQVLIRLFTSMEELRRWEDKDILVNIFRRLSLEDLILAVPFVCHSWFKASLDPLCWTTLNFQALDSVPFAGFAKRFESAYSLPDFSFSDLLKLLVCRGHGLVTELKFPSLFRASIHDLVYASDKCPRLKVLGLPDLMPEDELQIPRLICKWKDLELLEMELKPSCFLEVMEEISINCGKFNGLRMSGSVDRKDADAIVNCTPHIKYLDLSRSYLPREELLVIVDGCKEIEVLSANKCIGFELDKEVMNRVSGVKVFECEGSKLRDYHVYDSFGWDQLYFGVFF